MNKELIERIALEVAKDYLKFKLGDRKGLDIYDIDLDDEDLKPLIAEIERECADSFMQFLTRIDAERGKEVVAWVDTLEAAQPRCVTNLDYRSVTEAKLGVEYIPLFLSPTIPEGMALVPVEPTAAMVVAGVKRMLNKDDPTTELYNIYKAMLSAAQGERNAD